MDDPFEYQLNLDHGVFRLTIPRKITLADLTDISDLFNLALRQSQRRIFFQETHEQQAQQPDQSDRTETAEP